MTPPSLTDRLRELAAYAEAGGSPRELLDAVLPPLLELLLDDVGRRRLAALQDDRRLRALVAQVGPGVAARRLGVHRSTVHRRLSRDTAT